jgi:uncharacterized protein YebE (UPF0316 family)
MMRKMLAVVVALGMMVGVTMAEEIKATFVKFAEGKLTVKIEDKEKTYDIPADLKGAKGLAKVKEGAKLILKVEDEKVVGLKMEKKKEGDKKPDVKKEEPKKEEPKKEEPKKDDKK